MNIKPQVIALLLALSLTVLCPNPVFSANPCDMFIDKGSSLYYRECSLFLEKSLEAKEYISGLYIEGDVRFKHLINGIRSGNEHFVSLAFIIRLYADGGILEDINEAIGLIFAKHPELVLSMFMKYKLNEESMEEILLNLPENLVDDLTGQIKELDKRIKALKRVRKEELAAIKRKCMQILEAEKEDEVRIIKQLQEKER